MRVSQSPAIPTRHRMASIVVACALAGGVSAHPHHPRAPAPPIRTISANGEQSGASADATAPTSIADVAPTTTLVGTQPQSTSPAPLAEAQLDARGMVIAPRRSLHALHPYGAQFVRPHRTVASGAHAPSAAIATLIDVFARRYQVDPKLVTAVMQTESGFRLDAVSPKGALGPMQLMPHTAARLGFDPTDPVQNIEGGVAYLAWLLHRYEGNTAFAVAGYNAGEGAVDRWGGIPPYAETMHYVRRVGALYARGASPPIDGVLAALQPAWRTIDADGDHPAN